MKVSKKHERSPIAVLPRKVDGRGCSLVTGDLPGEALDEARNTGQVAVDIETTGLDWRNNHIATVQVNVPDCAIYIIQVKRGNGTPVLDCLLENRKIRKIFHHAMFDLRFLAFHNGVDSQNIACTKIASKILYPERDGHSLSGLLREKMGVVLDKTPATSDWSSAELSERQIKYATRDVVYLPDLIAILMKELEECHRLDIAEEAFDFVPTRVKLDLLGAGDVFTY